jgi:hypothetical protein
MGVGGWMRVLDTVGGLAELAGRMVGGRTDAPPQPVAGAATPPGAAGAIGALGHIEARLTGVLVAALKEAFDRDSARLELERAQQQAEERRREAEQRRLDEALKAEVRRQELEARRQAVERSLAQLRTVALVAAGVWALSAVLAVVVPGMRADVPRAILGVGWLCAIGSVGAVVTASQRLARWRVAEAASPEPPHDAVAVLAPWLLVAALATIALALLVAL